MVTIDTKSLIPELVVLDATQASPVSPSSPLSPTTFSTLTDLTMNGYVDLLIASCMSGKGAALLTEDFKKGQELKSTFNPEQFKPDFQQASVEDLAELAQSCLREGVILKEMFTEIEKELLSNRYKLGEAASESLIKLVTAFNKADLLSPELAQAVLQSADAPKIAKLLGAFSMQERVDRAFLAAIESELLAEQGKKMWASPAQELDSISRSFRQVGYGDRDLHKAIHTIWFIKARKA